MDDLTPSKTVLLNGERFAEKRLVGNVRLLHTDREVAADRLARAIVMAAALANQEDGVIRFETGELSRWFGLRSRAALFVELAGEASWPRYTLEWAVPTFLEEVQYQEGPDRVPMGPLVDSSFDGDYSIQNPRCRVSISESAIERISRQSRGCEASVPGVGPSGPGCKWSRVLCSEGCRSDR